MVQEISLQGLALAFVPAGAVIAILLVWSAGAGTAIYATVRMLVQLLLIGYLLVYIFEAEHPAIVAVVLAIMISAASLIAIRTIGRASKHALRDAFVAIAGSGIVVLALVSQLVIAVDPWFDPQYVIPLAGMIFAGAMNAVSLAAERFKAESTRGVSLEESRRIAFSAALIPITNSLFAVGVVSLPGMMTGQILSGVSPLIAAKYQIVVMTMMFGVAGLAAATFLQLQCRQSRGADTG